MWKFSLHYLQNWQNYAAFSHGTSAVETLSKIVLTIQDRANAVSANTFLSRDKCLECLPSLFTYSCQTTCKTRDNFINWTCGKMSHIFCDAIFNSEIVLGFGRWFQNSFVSRSPDTISPFHSNLWVIRWQLFIFNHLRLVLLDALLRDSCNARRVPCILLNLPLHLATVGCILLMNFGIKNE